MLCGAFLSYDAEGQYLELHFELNVDNWSEKIIIPVDIRNFWNAHVPVLPTFDQYYRGTRKCNFLESLLYSTTMYC